MVSVLLLLQKVKTFPTASVRLMLVGVVGEELSFTCKRYCKTYREVDSFDPPIDLTDGQIR